MFCDFENRLKFSLGKSRAVERMVPSYFIYSGPHNLVRLGPHSVLGLGKNCILFLLLLYLIFGDFQGLLEPQISPKDKIRTRDYNK